MQQISQNLYTYFENIGIQIINKHTIFCTFAYTNNCIHEGLNLRRLNQFQGSQGIVQMLFGFMAACILLESLNAVIQLKKKNTINGHKKLK